MNIVINMTSYWNEGGEAVFPYETMNKMRSGTHGMTKIRDNPLCDVGNTLRFEGDANDSDRCERNVGGAMNVVKRQQVNMIKNSSSREHGIGNSYQELQYASFAKTFSLNQNVSKCCDFS